MMEYKGYTGQLTAVDEAQGLIHGNVADINDVVTSEGKTLEELVQAFHESVDHYLGWCEERAEAPEKPFSGKFLVRIAPDLHTRAFLAAKKSGLSLNAWVASAMQAQIDKKRATRKRRTNGAKKEDLNRLLGLLELRSLRELREREEEPSSERHKIGED